MSDGDRMGWAALALVAAFTLVFLVNVIVQHRKRAAARALARTGLPTKGRVLRLVADTAEDDLFLATLEIDPDSTGGRAGPRTSIDVWLHVPSIALPSVQPGKTIALRYDPGAPERPVLDLRAMGFDHT